MSSHMPGNQDLVRTSRPAVVTHAGTSTLKTTPDFSQTFSDLVDTLKALFRDLTVHVQGGSESAAVYANRCTGHWPV